jgi:ParB family chromosome partitioning protein
MSNNKRSALGRGLSALLESAETDVTTRAAGANAPAPTGVVGSVAVIPLEQIEANPFQPRTEFKPEELKELAQSIKEQGIIQPITVRKLGYDKYQIISGERRFRASKLAGLEAIPAYIRVANDQGMLEMALVENIQRQDLNPIDVAISYKRLIDECSLTQEQLSERVGKNRTTVTNFVRLLKLPPEIQAALRDNRITMGHARAILGVDDIGHQLILFREILEKQLSVRDVEERARQASGKRSQGEGSTPGSSGRSLSQKQFEYEKIRKVLSSHFSAKVQLTHQSDGSGKITIPFGNDEDLNRILELLNY